MLNASGTQKVVAILSATGHESTKPPQLIKNTQLPTLRANSFLTISTSWKFRFALGTKFSPAS